MSKYLTFTLDGLERRFSTYSEAAAFSRSHTGGVDVMHQVGGKWVPLRGGEPYPERASPRSGGSYCSKCRGPHVYKHGRA